ncbi:MAG TPA: hypothetical protein V6D47_10610 [Oscillatoriaceae cyanobacterium]
MPHPVLVAGLLSAIGGMLGFPSASVSVPLTLRFARLVPIDVRDGHYALWAVGEGAPAKLADFLVDAQERPSALDGKPIAFLLPADLREARLFVTQEPPGAIERTPSRQVFLEGTLHAGRARLDAPIRLRDYAACKGVFLLDNPETPNDSSDLNGIWFSGYLSKRYTTGLTLPEAPDGWMYEGWTILRGIPLRMGKFRSPNDNEDWDGYSGRSGATPVLDPAGQPMPGQDFNADLPPGIETGRNRPALDGARVIVSLENATLAGEERYPSPIRIFEGTVPRRPTQDRPYPLENVLATCLPAGTAAIR